MKYKKISMISVLIAFCLAFQVQPVCAQEITENGEVSSEEMPADETPADDLSEDENPPGDTPEDTDSTDDSAEEEKREDEPVQELTPPAKLTGLHTTCESDKKVLIEWDDSEGAAYYCVYRKKENGAYKKLGNTEKTSFQDTSGVFGKTYEYMVVPYNVEDTEGKEATIQLVRKQAVNIKTQKYTYHQMQTDMKELAKQYSNYCELTAIGTSVEGRKIYDLAIGNQDAQKSLLVVSTLHAREYICSAMLMQEIEYYLRNYKNYRTGRAGKGCIGMYCLSDYRCCKGNG